MCYGAESLFSLLGPARRVYGTYSRFLAIMIKRYNWTRDGMRGDPEGVYCRFDAAYQAPGEPPQEWARKQLRKISYVTGVSVPEIRSKSRRQEYMMARQIAMHLLNARYGCKWAGEILNKHHTTVLHGARRISELARLEPETAELLAACVHKA